MNTKTKTKILHSPVLVEHVLAVLQPKEGESYLDLTAGYGGHATSVLEFTQKPSAMFLCDRDPSSVNFLTEHMPKEVRLIQDTFLGAIDSLLEHDATFDMILADLGVSSPHLDNAERGFSVSKNGPLDMRMDPTRGFSAAVFLNTATPSEIERVLKVYGEEPKARRIASDIISKRPLQTTEELVQIVKKHYPGYSKHNPAIRTFQAIRIHVNDELRLLSEMLPRAIRALKPGARFAVITFHSLEDRIVKQFFQNEVQKGFESEISIVTKKPMVASADEISSNPRARSAKLRAVVKNKKKGP